MIQDNSFFMVANFMTNMLKNTKVLLTIFSVMFLSACFTSEETQESSHTPVVLESTDECHLCGMLITHFPGPKGELFRKEVSAEESKKARKFCSTRDMFSYYLDPEHKRNVTTVLVHDMSKSPWNTPNDDYFINAKNAWFVVGSEKRGAMGKTLASFSMKPDAEAFAQEHGGVVIAFEQITLSTLQ